MRVILLLFLIFVEAVEEFLPAPLGLLTVGQVPNVSLLPTVGQLMELIILFSPSFWRDTISYSVRYGNHSSFLVLSISFH